MATLVANAAVDMTDWNFNNIKLGTINLHSSVKYTITGASGGLQYQFTGSGLTYDAGNLLTGGVVSSYRVLDGAGNTILSVNGFSISATALEAAIQNGDAGGAFENAVFANTNTILGSAFDDTLSGFSTGTETISGGDGNDIIIDVTEGNAALIHGDHIAGGAGDDTIHLGGKWDGNDIDGGEGYDTVYFNGDYPLGFTVSDAVFKNLEQFIFLGGPNYNFHFGGIVAEGETLRVDASNLGGSAKVQIDGSGELVGQLEFLGSAGTDVFRGGALDDVFWLTKAGKDKVYGGEGDDTFVFGATLTNVDRVRGGDGSDVLKLDGNYNLTFADATIADLESIDLAGNRDYTLVMADDNVDAGADLVIFGYALGAGDKLVFDGSAEQDGTFGIVDGAGDDTLTGGAQADTFAMSKGGHNIINGGAGDDTVGYLGNGFNGLEVINGGTGNDTVGIEGDYSTGLTLTGTMLTSIETFTVSEGFDYDITIANTVIAAGQTLALSGSGLTKDFSARFDGSGELDGKFVMVGGDGKDTLLAGAGKDTLTGGGGADFLSGGGNNDTFIYLAASDSTGRKYDTIDSFNATNELIDVENLVTGRDADIVGGTLSKATFDVDLAAKADAAHLLANHAVLFKPNAGNLAGHSFLVIDQNGVAGYQTGEDIVIDMTNLSHAGDIAIATFV